MTNPQSIIKIDNLMRSDFGSCPRFYYYRHELGLTVSDPGPRWALNFGIAMHTGLETHFKLMKEGKTDLKAVVQAFAKDFPNDQPAPMLKKGPGEALYTKVRGAFLLQEYTEHHSKELFEVIDVEIGAAEELAPGIFYCGRIDLFAGFDNGVRAIDHKTTGRMDRLTSNPNNQFMGYQWLAEQYFDKCAGIVCDVIGVYKTKPIDECFDRQYEKFGDYQMETWKQETIFEANRIRMHREMGVWPCRTDHCGAYGGRCAFLPLCTSISSEGERSLMETMYVVDRWEPYKEPGEEVGT